MKTVTLLLFFLWALPTLAADHKVSSSADIAAALSTLEPGDTLVMTDGTWTDEQILFKADGTAEKPITLRAESPGKVILTGNSTLKIQGQHLLISGLHLHGIQSTGDAITLSGNHNRLTESAVTGEQSKSKFFIHIFGADNRLDHCYLADKTSADPTLQIEVDEHQPNHHEIDHNHFGHRPPLGKNGGETIRVGYSFQSMFSSKTTVEKNLFDQCDGEIEIISSKSCDNIYRYNSFINCAGFLTLRHGNRCTVKGNYFNGQNKKGSGGVRIIGEDHTITNNFFSDLTDGVFRITSGIPESELKGYFQSKRCKIEKNTAQHCKGAYLELDAGIGTSRRTLRPQNITIAGNFFVLPPQGATLIKGQEGEGWTWNENIAVGKDLAGDLRGFFIRDRNVEIKLSIDTLTPKDVGPSWSVDIRSQPPHNPGEEK